MSSLSKVSVDSTLFCMACIESKASVARSDDEGKTMRINHFMYSGYNYKGLTISVRVSCETT